MDKVALGRKGEIFVLSHLLKNGWKLPDNIIDVDMRGTDWIFEKNDIIIKVQVKTSEEQKSFKASNDNFDFIAYTDLNDIYWIPKVLLKYRSLDSVRFTEEFEKLKGRDKLLEMKGYELCLELQEVLGRVVFP